MFVGNECLASLLPISINTESTEEGHGQLFSLFHTEAREQGVDKLKAAASAYI